MKKIEYFCKHNDTSKKDVLVILGDAGINYWLNNTDKKNKKKLEALPITIFVIHGNHEERPYNISSYKESLWNGGIVYCEEEYPSLLFAMDGEIYDLNGKKAIAIGGAYSVDKNYRCMVGLPWFPDEQPSYAVKEAVRNGLGITIISNFVASSAAENKELITIELDKSYNRSFSYILPKNINVTKATNIFLEEFKNYLSSINN